MIIILKLLLAILLPILYLLRNLGRRPPNLPPGPPTLPILGNLHQMPTSKPHLQFQKWAQEYGPVYSLILGSSVMIVLSSDRAVKDLMDKRSNVYSSRPPLYIGQIISGGLRMLLMEYGKTWRMIRGTVHDHLNIRASKNYIPYQDLESRHMLVGFLKRPERWIDHMRRYTNSLTTQMVFGFRTTDIDDPKMHQLYHGFAEFSECFGSPAAQLLDIFPILRHLPTILLPVKKRAMELNRKETDLYVGHWLTAKHKIENGTANPCMCVDLVASQIKEGFSDPLAAYISGSMLEAGSDTTWSTLVGFMQAMLLFPDVAKKAQEEIDRVCGDRMPSLEDEPQMQYIRGCVKESMRWMPTAILGIPHAVIRDDEYMGYSIPKGATVLLNVWAIHNNPNRFPSPRTFDPMRFNDDHQTAAEAALNADPAKRDHFLFGAGRRVCQGMHIAERSMFLAISRLLWAYDFKIAEDENRKEIVPDADELTEGVLIQPKWFPVRVTAREGKEKSVMEEWKELEQNLLDSDGQWKMVPEGIFSKAKTTLKTE